MNTERITEGSLVLYGGTFAPPHLGHVHAVKAVMRELQPECLLVMPTAVPPHKQKAKGDTAAIRFQMCRAAFSGISGVSVSSYEIDKGGISYTVDTLEYLKTKAGKIWLMCGTDMFLTLDSWKSAERIFELASIVCMPRYDASFEELQERKTMYESTYGTEVKILESRVLEMTSTDVRKKIADGEDLSCCLPESVLEIIRREKLYTQEETE